MQLELMAYHFGEEKFLPGYDVLMSKRLKFCYLSYC
jgi:hypothetical protein